MIDDQECPKSGKHRDLEASQIMNRKCAVKKIKEAISHFIIPRKIVVIEKLYCLASGAPVSEEKEKNILLGNELGKTHSYRSAWNMDMRNIFWSCHTAEVNPFSTNVP